MSILTRDSLHFTIGHCKRTSLLSFCHLEWILSSARCSQSLSVPRHRESQLSRTVLKYPLMGHGESYFETSHVCPLCLLIDIDFGHDKSRAIRPYAALPAAGRPILVYCGDGVSDISAAKETDLLFAKKGRDLVVHCLNENVPFYPFDVYRYNIG
jgi:hypothetical protein